MAVIKRKNGVDTVIATKGAGISVETDPVYLADKSNILFKTDTASNSTKLAGRTLSEVSDYVISQIPVNLSLSARLDGADNA